MKARKCTHPLEKLTILEEVRGWMQSHSVRLGRAVHCVDETAGDYTGQVRVLCRGCGFDKVYSKWSKLPERFRSIFDHVMGLHTDDVWDAPGQECLCVERWLNGRMRVVWMDGCKLHPTPDTL